MRAFCRYAGTTLALSAAALSLATQARAGERSRLGDVKSGAFATLLGPQLHAKATDGGSVAWRLTTAVGKTTDDAGTRILATIGYEGDWRGYVRATEGAASSLVVDGLKSRVGGCTPRGCALSETVAVDLPLRWLVAHTGCNAVIKLTAASGQSVTLRLAAAQIDAQLKALADFRAAHPVIARFARVDPKARFDRRGFRDASCLRRLDCTPPIEPWRVCGMKERGHAGS